MSQSYPLWHHIPVRLRRRQLDVHRLVSQFRLCHQVRQTQIRVRSRHQITVPLLHQFLLHPLCHTSQHPYNQGIIGNLFPLLSRRLRLHGAIFCWGGLICLLANPFNSCNSLFFYITQRRKAMINLLFRIVPDTARVQEHGVSLFQPVRCLVPGHLHHAGHYLRVCHVHLAPVCFYV